MANSAHTTTIEKDRNQFGNLGKLRTRRAKITFGSDYAAATLPLITAKELGLSEVLAVIPEGAAAGTAAGSSVVVAINTSTGTSGQDFTLKLFNGTTAIGTVDESGTTIQLLVVGV
jgi:hypothetical protein